MILRRRRSSLRICSRRLQRHDIAFFIDSPLPSSRRLSCFSLSIDTVLDQFPPHVNRPAIESGSQYFTTLLARALLLSHILATVPPSPIRYFLTTNHPDDNLKLSTVATFLQPSCLRLFMFSFHSCFFLSIHLHLPLHLHLIAHPFHFAHRFHLCIFAAILLHFCSWFFPLSFALWKLLNDMTTQVDK